VFILRISLALALAVVLQPPLAADSARPRKVGLRTLEGLTPQGVDATVVRHRGRAAVRLVESDPASDAHAIAIVDGTGFENGTIEIDLAGEPLPGAQEGARGFVGLAFRVAPDRSRFEYIYIRPTNGRANDQLRRNHSTQYASHPDFPWHRLRKESPGVYESYADLESGAWTQLKIVVSGTTARLFVNRAPQPSLIVNDLKNPAADGAVALWVGPGGAGYFSNLVITPGD
jgi:hypothetical protein